MAHVDARIKRRGRNRKRTAVAVAEPKGSQPRGLSLAGYAGVTDENFGPFVDGASLVLSVNGDTWPPSNSTDFAELVYFARHEQGLYAAAIGAVMVGQSMRAAFTKAGIVRGKLNNWLDAGHQHLTNGIDSYCSRFFLDMRRATSIAIAFMEQRVAEKDPLTWLQFGPGRDYFGDDPTWLPIRDRALAAAQQNESQLEPLAVVPADAQAQAELDSASPSQQKLVDALAILDANGITAQPDFAQQLREQYRLPSSSAAVLPATQ